MKSRSRVAILVLPALAICAGLAIGPLGRAAPPTKDGIEKSKQAEADKMRKADLAKMTAAVAHNGKLSAANYWHHAELLHHGKKRTIVATRLDKMSAKGAKPLAKTFDPKAGKRSTLTVIGEDVPPPGFGHGFDWDRAEDVTLVMFINAADSTGVSINGVQAGDKVRIVSAVGNASFSESSLKKIVSSLVAVAGVAGTILAPEAKDAIAAAEKVIIEQTNGMNLKRKCRDAFGEDPASGAKACQEGGLLVCMPGAGGIYYSGDRDHKVRWIKQPGDRTDAALPAHIAQGYAFFPRRGDSAHNTRIAKETGPMFVTAWDFAYGDNAGYYKVFVTLTKGNGPPVEPNPTKKGPNAKPKK